MPVVRTAGLFWAGLATAAALAHSAVPAAASAGAPPSGDPPAASTAGPSVLLARLQSLYLRAERAAETYDGVEDELDDQESRYDTLAGRLAARRSAVGAARDAVGELAREQYRGGGVSSYARLLFSRDPTEALTQAHILGRAAVGREVLARRLRTGESALATAAVRARTSLDAVRDLTDRRMQDRDDAVGSLDDMERVVARMPGGRLIRLAGREGDGRRARRSPGSARGPRPPT